MSLEKIAARKKIVFDQKLKALDKEIEVWCEMSREGEPFDKHYTQIRSIKAHIEPWKSHIKTKLTEYENEEAEIFLTNCKKATNLILTEHRVWEYFRRKLIQRKDDNFHKYLKVADEFAWSCYEPIQKKTDIELKEPPLVFFNGGASPFSVSREKTFQTELVKGSDINAEITNDQIKKLPISVVGVPWDQINHLAEASVIGHEVGHIIENDFGLTDDVQHLLNKAIEKIPDGVKRKSAWESWLKEIFADLYGCLAVGPAYAGTLLDYLADAKSKIDAETRSALGWRAYPTVYLRMKVILKILTEMGFADEIEEYTETLDTYSSSMPEEFVDDIEIIVPHLLDGKFKRLGETRIIDVISFTRTDQDNVERTIVNIIEKIEIPRRNIRVLFAVSRLLFEENPTEYTKKEYNDLIIDLIINKVIEPGYRSGVVFSTIEKKLKRYRKTSEDVVSQTFDGFF